MSAKTSYPNFSRKSFNSPRGNVLLLALLILASGIIGGLSIAVLVISDLKQAKTIDDGLIAYYDAEGGLEQSLYDIRKDKICDTNVLLCKEDNYIDCTSPNIALATVSTSTPGALKCQRKIAPAQEIRIPYLDKDKTVQLDLDPNAVDLNGNVVVVSNIQVSWNRTSDPDSPLLEVTYININTLSGDTSIFRPEEGVPYQCEYDGSKCLTRSLALPESGEATYQVRFKALTSPIIGLTLTPDIPGLDSYIDVKSKGERANTTTVLQTIISKQIPAYGFSDYVIFSEQDIVK
jgi:hypothetical protein